MISNKNLNPILSNEPQKEMNILTTSLIGINALCFMYEMVVIGYVICQEKCVKRKKNEKSSTEELKIKNNKTKTQVLPTFTQSAEEQRDLREWQSGTTNDAASKSQNTSTKTVLPKRIAQL